MCIHSGDYFGAVRSLLYNYSMHDTCALLCAVRTLLEFALRVLNNFSQPLLCVVSFNIFNWCLIAHNFTQNYMGKKYLKFYLKGEVHENLYRTELCVSMRAF